jgi:hypothetical protein
MHQARAAIYGAYGAEGVHFKECFKYWIMIRVGQNHIYLRCVYGIFGSETTKYTVIYGVYVQCWPTLHIYYIYIYVRCICGIFGMEITKYTVIYGVYIYSGQPKCDELLGEAPTRT